MQESLISLRRPPETWEDGFPVGTGRISAMIFGTKNSDFLALNHERLWTDLYSNRRNNPEAHQQLPVIRRLLREKKWIPAGELLNDVFVPRGGHSSEPAHVDSFQPAGTIAFRFDAPGKEYSRALNMETGLVTIVSDGIRREYLANLHCDLLSAHFVSDSLFDVSLELPPGYSVNRISPEKFSFEGVVPGNVFHRTLLQFKTEGRSPGLSDRTLHFQNIRELTVFWNTGCGFTRQAAESESEFTFPESYADSLKASACEMRKILDNAAEIFLPESGEKEFFLEDRRAKARSVPDPGLIILYFHYARYLMTSCSLRGTLPANLQGKWNANPNPPWRSDYHININLQMNYWMADPGNMGKFNLPLFRLIERAIPAGRQAARDLFGCRGIWFPWAFDLSGSATPEGHGWGVWIGSAPWLGRHLRNYYEYTLDRAFLAGTAYPYLKECCEFFEDFLTPDSEGTLHISPSQSPENLFRGGFDPVSICEDSAVDIEIVGELLRDAIQSAEELGVDPEKRALWQSMRAHLPPIQIGPDGRLLEWSFDAEEVEPGHRHISHLYALYPGNSIDEAQTPELYESARRTLQYRLSHSGGQTGWSRAWCACFLAALRDGNAAEAELNQLILNQSSESLLDLHPPRIFQIDGNFGAAAAVFAMLLRSEHGVLEPLPALPDNWSAGEAKNLCGKGGFLLDLRWENGKIVSARIFAKCGGFCKIRVSSELRNIGNRGNSVPFERTGNIRRFAVDAGETYELEFVKEEKFRVRNHRTRIRRSTRIPTAALALQPPREEYGTSLPAHRRKGFL